MFNGKLFLTNQLGSFYVLIKHISSLVDTNDNIFANKILTDTKKHTLYEKCEPAL